ncbi:sensor histidine kinase [Spirosoma rhododendri]|uniref:histidine kinase n=1 Tax=Spirosoma rhododendri TaxID=2728024 RepID=A0A7L5DPP6_9BACT|nr:ATP-binding protein [Spirosoma rhododendri]QJD80376.1 PAS domain-containing protein [Spirosoma rhododendri]
MSFLTRYLLYLTGLHLTLAGLAYTAFKTEPVWLVGSEVVLLGSLLLGADMYRTFQRPGQYIGSGIEAIRDKDFTIKFVPTGNRDVDELIRVYNLMIDQLRQERTHQAEQQSFLDKLIDASPIALLIFDYDGRITSANPKAVTLLRRPLDTLLNRLPDEIAHPLLSQFMGLPAEQPQLVQQTGIERYRVLRATFMDRGFARQFLLIEELTAELITTEKNAYGKVIRMMAHEVNNSIGAVNSIMQTLTPELPDADSQRAMHVAIDRNDRLNGFMRRFADVVRIPPPVRTRVDLRDVVQQVGQLMGPPALKQGVSITVAVPDNPVCLSVDVGQLEQVLVNIVKNALEACEAGRQVQIRLEARRLQVLNNGHPIPTELANRLFDPFLSTKATGQGIGLMVVRDILLNHGFTFSLKTQPDGWTVFRIEWDQLGNGMV